MSHGEPASLRDGLERWAQAAVSEGWVEQWAKGAIYPSEMVFFLARCEAAGIDCVVESGRQDGFSTIVLGEYARRRGAKVFSIDYEQDEERAARCRERLAGYPELALMKGDANVLLEQIVRAETGSRIALLVDGPKGFWALALMFACSAHPAVGLLALHNLEAGQATTTMLEALSPEPLFHEAWTESAGPAWRALMAAELELCWQRIGAEQQPSTLGTIAVSDRLRPRLAGAWHRGFRLFQPPILRLGWRMGMFRATGWLIALSFRFLR
jgi:hypothetical protein